MGKRANFRTDSTLGNLPPERQDEIAAFLVGVKKGDRFEATRKHLMADGLKVGRTAVFDWYQAWRLRRRFSSADNFAQQVQDALQSLNLGLTQDQLDTAGQLTFTKKALEEDDAAEFREMQYLHLARKTAETKGRNEATKISQKEKALAMKREEVDLAREKFEIETCEKILLAANDARTREIASASGMSNAEKIAELRKKYFQDVDTLEASGKVVLPE